MNRLMWGSLFLVLASLRAYAATDATRAAADAAPAGPQNFAAEWTYLDADGDGRISATELAQGQRMAAMILTLSLEAGDPDHDGKLTPAEFQAAVTTALQTLASADNEGEQPADEELARAVPLSLVFQQLSGTDTYAAELAALREAVTNLDDEETVVTHIISNPARYPRLGPLVRTWVRYYPVRPELRRHVPPGLPHVPHPAQPPGLHVPPPRPKTGQPGVTKPSHAVKPSPKPAPPPRGSGRP
jgi:hypothetical protein